MTDNDAPVGACHTTHETSLTQLFYVRNRTINGNEVALEHRERRNRLSALGRSIMSRSCR